VTTPSHADIIGQYIKLRDYVAEQGKAHNERMKPYNEAMEKLEAFMGAALQAQAGEEGKSSIATPQGTCFRKLSTSIKVADREAWMDFIFDGRREGYITNHVSKDAIKEYMDQFKSTPPGIDVTPRWDVQFRSPKEKTE
jgi:hypothetical protein